MPIETIAGGAAAFAGKQNEIINAINALQTNTIQQILWHHGTGATTTQTLTAGTWIVAAFAQGEEANGVAFTLYIDEETKAAHNGNDDGGLNYVTLVGVAEIIVPPGDPYDLEIAAGGYSTFSRLSAVLFKTA